ncbi:MAG: hypothetical protein AVDCRST_MAG77-934 [uncultured Chloroflexi bacterium]|uniref:Uncharacterized protein n=1 Tax=uncultured Chloroflexota bacterium TaxID=166587 RepID=A0A6J4HNH5_9CHLR|nr:MAG: hypothetical protein AVDCRST_MAG77-934 [uncultured Chloroflexota bacterium]
MWLLLFLLVMYGFVTIPAIMVALFLGGLVAYGYILRHVRSAGVHGPPERGAADVSSGGKSG